MEANIDLKSVNPISKHSQIIDASIKPSSRVKTSMATKNFIGEQVSPFIDDKLLLPSCVFINYLLYESL